LPVTFLRWLFRTIEWLVFAGVLIVGGYVLMMSGIFHRPDTVFTAAPYRHAGGGILVVGGTRGTGLEVIRELLVRGEQVTAMVRESSDTRALDALGVERVVADAMNAEEVRTAIPDGAYAAVISALATSPRDLPEHKGFVRTLLTGPVRMDPEKRPDYVGNRNVIDAAKAAGVSRFVLLTVIGAGDSAEAVPLPARDANSDIIPVKEKAEAYLRESGLDYTIIRPGWLGDVAATGTAVLTEDPLSFSYIARKDLAKLTVLALGDKRTIGRTYSAYDPSRRYIWELYTD
jgi:uncharacterized protein YbjT (DUF2867 family)